MKKNLIYLFIIFISLNLNAFSKECTIEDAKIAETAVTKVKTWNDLYTAWKIYKHCDDGAIAEGFCEVITILLSEEWRSLNSIIKIINLNPSFRSFIIDHINEVSTADRVEKIKKNALSNCNQKSKNFCKEIIYRIDHLNKQLLGSKVKSGGKNGIKSLPLTL